MYVHIATHDDAHTIDGVSFEDVTGYGAVTLKGAVSQCSLVARTGPRCLSENGQKKRRRTGRRH
jgi:hypothetical protein